MNDKNEQTIHDDIDVNTTECCSSAKEGCCGKSSGCANNCDCEHKHTSCKHACDHKQHNSNDLDFHALHEKAIAEVAEWKDKALRIAADLENTRKRSAKEIEDAKSYSLSNFAREVLSIKDSMDRALEALPKTENDEVKVLSEGIEMVSKQIDRVFEQFGVTHVESLDMIADPNFHQVMMQEESDKPTGTIIKELQKGYKIKDRLLRPAFVSVAK